MKKAIVIGATSGIGQEVARLLAHNGYEVGVAGRRETLLKEIEDSEEGVVAHKVIDINDDDSPALLGELIDELGGIDLYFHSSGIGYQNPSLDADKEMRTTETNVRGFTRMINAAYHYFEKKGTGHIAVISSIAGVKGLGAAPAYSATKAYQNTYVEALSQLSNMKGHNVTFTDIRPGFVATDLLNDGAKYPMLLDKKYVAKKIMTAISKKKKVAIIDWKYSILVFFWKLVPRSIWVKMKVTTAK